MGHRKGNGDKSPCPAYAQTITTCQNTEREITCHENNKYEDLVILGRLSYDILSYLIFLPHIID